MTAQGDAERLRKAIETKRTISHDEAVAIVRRFIAGHFQNMGERPRISIPADTERDDDILLLSYIEQNRRPAAPAEPPAVGKVERVIEQIVREVAELPDRTSPDDAPDMMLVTADELSEIIRAALPEPQEEKGT